MGQLSGIRFLSSKSYISQQNPKVLKRTRCTRSGSVPIPRFTTLKYLRFGFRHVIIRNNLDLKLLFTPDNHFYSVDILGATAAVIPGCVSFLPKRLVLQSLSCPAISVPAVNILGATATVLSQAASILSIYLMLQPASCSKLLLFR